jgi:hypothetical protein
MKFNVFVPCTASVCVTVDADSEEEAKQLALDAEYGIKVDTKGCGNTVNVEIHEFEAHTRITRGNTFCGVQNEIEVCEAE